MFENLFMGNQSVMIVKSNGKEAQYAQMLFQMIGKIPNFESSQPISESEYNASFVTIDNTPKGKIIFFGNGKEAEIQGKAVVWQYDRFGMRYGWLGNRCVITTSADKISTNDLNDFADYYNSKVKEFHSLVDNVKFSEIEHSEQLDMNEVYDLIKWKENDDTAEKVAKTLTAIVGSPLILLFGGVRALNDTVTKFEMKDVWKRQYELLVCEFMINGFTLFMNNIIEKTPKNQSIIIYDNKEAEYAHLLHNLIQQYSGYDVAEYTEKIFIDNAKELSSKNKIIFLGKTKSSKERWLDIYRYRFYENGMRYGWNGNQAFVCIKPLKKSERESFIEAYNQKREGYSNKAKAYLNTKKSKVGKNVAAGLNVLQGVLSPITLSSLPSLIGDAVIKQVVGTAVDKTIDSAKTTTDLSGYQYQLLLREFVFNGFEEFMEA